MQGRWCFDVCVQVILLCMTNSDIGKMTGRHHLQSSFVRVESEEAGGVILAPKSKWHPHASTESGRCLGSLMKVVFCTRRDVPFGGGFCDFVALSADIGVALLPNCQTSKLKGKAKSIRLDLCCWNRMLPASSYEFVACWCTGARRKTFVTTFYGRSLSTTIRCQVYQHTLGT